MDIMNVFSRWVGSKRSEIHHCLDQWSHVLAKEEKDVFRNKIKAITITGLGLGLSPTTSHPEGGLFTYVKKMTDPEDVSSDSIISHQFPQVFMGSEVNKKTMTPPRSVGVGPVGRNMEKIGPKVPCWFTKNPTVSFQPTTVRPTIMQQQFTPTMKNQCQWYEQYTQCGPPPPGYQGAMPIPSYQPDSSWGGHIGANEYYAQKGCYNNSSHRPNVYPHNMNIHRPSVFRGAPLVPQLGGQLNNTAAQIGPQYHTQANAFNYQPPTVEYQAQTQFHLPLGTPYVLCQTGSSPYMSIIPLPSIQLVVPAPFAPNHCPRQLNQTEMRPSNTAPQQQSSQNINQGNTPSPVHVAECCSQEIPSELSPVSNVPIEDKTIDNQQDDVTPSEVPPNLKFTNISINQKQPPVSEKQPDTQNGYDDQEKTNIDFQPLVQALKKEDIQCIPSTSLNNSESTSTEVTNAGPKEKTGEISCDTDNDTRENVHISANPNDVPSPNPEYKAKERQWRQKLCQKPVNATVTPIPRKKKKTRPSAEKRRRKRTPTKCSLFSRNDHDKLDTKEEPCKTVEASLSESSFCEEVKAIGQCMSSSMALVLGLESPKTEDPHSQIDTQPNILGKISFSISPCDSDSDIENGFDDSSDSDKDDVVDYFAVFSDSKNPLICGALNLCNLEPMTKSASAPQLQYLNDSWEINADLNDSINLTKRITKVKFASDDTLVTVYLLEESPEESREARKGPWETLARDRDRFQNRIERVENDIAHVFTKEHREIMFKKLYPYE